MKINVLAVSRGGIINNTNTQTDKKEKKERL